VGWTLRELFFLGSSNEIVFARLTPQSQWPESPRSNSFQSPGLPDFSWYVRNTQTEKMYQMNTKWSHNIPNGRKILQMAFQHQLQNLTTFIQNLPKFGFLVGK
jgi:hypothetical protein